MGYSVVFTQGAESDLSRIYEYVCAQDGFRRAIGLLNKLDTACERLAEVPECGGYPKELAALGIKEYREIRLRPYRIFYTVEKRNVNVVLIADGRREMQTLLERRLLEG